MYFMKHFLLILLFIAKLSANENEVVLQLQWKHQFQFAGFYVAKEMGFYDEVGLDVTFKEYESSIDIVEDVISKKSTYGIGRSSLLLKKNKGKPIVLLSAIFQTSPSVLITTNPNIKSPSDLLGKKVMITKNAVESASITTMLLANGISKRDIVIQQHSFDYNDLINGTTDAMACYLSNEPYRLDEKNIKYRVFNPKDYDYDFYGDILFTSEDEIKNHSERVLAFHNASKKGWLWAFENIEKTAKIIYDKYNTQKKCLKSLIYEGEVLKKLAMPEDIPFGHISKKKFDAIAKIYQLSGLLQSSYTLDGFFDRLEINKYPVKIGVLAKRGAENTHKQWDSLAKYLNEEIDTYNFSIVPLDFEELERAVENNSVDFVITNTMYYVILESRYGISRIATLVNSDGSHISKEFGGVIFSRSNNKNINNFKDLEGNTFAAVHKLSFGGWVMGYEELIHNGIDIDDLKLSFLGTHDAVVEAVLSGKAEAGTVRTDTLERMAGEGMIDLSKIKILGAKTHIGFPYLVSTKLYPEWPIARLTDTSDNLANKLLAELVTYKPNLQETQISIIAGWSVPSDYSPVHDMLKELRLAPYDTSEIKLSEIIEQYSLYLSIIGFFLVVLITRLIYGWRVNIYLSEYSATLHKEVASKTNKLMKVNEKLKIIANTDSLTGVSNRGYFMRFAKKYFDIAKRNNEVLQILSLDLDYFKKINDTYGHQAGDDLLQEFANTISALLRKSDMLGRIGGEEFCILLQNTSIEGASLFAQRVCETIENLRVKSDGHILQITVSIGVATLGDEESVEDLIKKSDIALYQAKENGRNQVKVYSQT